MQSIGVWTRVGLAAVVATAACAESTVLPSGNAPLKIERFATTDDGYQTSVVGYDRDGLEVARLDLIHGRFKVTPPFTDDYDTAEVNGRKLLVDARGQQLHWETAGYEPVLEMPGHPPSAWALQLFLDDPHVKPVLDRWQIGFQAGAALPDGEDAYTWTQLITNYSGDIKGGSYATCDNSTTCGSTSNGTINTCGGTSAALTAKIVTQTPGTHSGLYTSGWNQKVVAQCCPTGSGGQTTPWFAIKACPTTSDNSTQCGTRSSGACKGCPSYPTRADWTCSVNNGSSIGSYGTEGTISDVPYAYSTYDYVWVCGQGGDFCDRGDDCCSGVCDEGFRRCLP